MAQRVTNFTAFYALLKRMPYIGDREELKRSLVLQGTGGRTDSLREVSPDGYTAICTMMERACPGYIRERVRRDALRRSRSVCLHLMQRIGVDTADWKAVNRYCLSPKIAGAEFRSLDIEGLDSLSLRLRMILKKQRPDGG